MSRQNLGRYQPEPVTEAENSALKSELVVVLFLLFVGFIVVFAEPLMDLAEAALR